MMKMITMQDECEVWGALKYLLIHLIFFSATDITKIKMMRKITMQDECKVWRALKYAT